MSAVLPLRYDGSGRFTCLRPGSITVEPGTVAGWQMAEHRSSKSHAHLFAVITDVWGSLPEGYADEWASPDALRKWALVKIGHCTTTKIACASNQEAINLVVAVRSLDAYAVVTLDGKIVTISQAKSIAGNKVKRAEFQQIKERVFDVLSELIGTDAATLAKEAA
jgi:hypothetical protein